ncbi:hypothetical protein WEH80_01595 [Actinomycetes bacterium KLBMP 9759]
MVGGLIRLKFVMQRHNVRWKRRLGLVFGVVAAAGTWVAALVFAGPAARADVLALALAAWMAGWIVGPVLTSGAAVLRPEYFVLLPLPRLRLGFGLLVSVFAGVGAVVTAGAVLAVVGYALTGPAGVAAVVVGLVGAALLLVVVVAFSRTVYALLGAAMRTRMGVEVAAVQYGLLIATMFAGWMVVWPVVQAVPRFLAEGFGGSAVSTVLGWLPTSWPLRAVDAAAAGDTAGVVAWLGALLLAAVVVVAAAVALLRPYVGNRTARRRRRPLGSRVLTSGRVLPASPLGAVTGKELRTWWRDPWRSLEVRSSIWFGLFLAGFGVIAGRPEIAGFAGVAVALMVALSGANLFGQDGTALWQLVVGQSRRAVRADIRGRQVAIVVSLGVPALVLSALMMALTGTFGYAVPVAAVIVAVLGAGSGVAVVFSVVGVTPGVEPHRRVNANDAGENIFAIHASLMAVQLLVAPTVVLAVLLVFVSGLPGWFGLLTMAVAVVNAAVVGWGGGAIAAARLGSHLPETFARLRYAGTSAARPGGGRGLLDYLARETEKAAVAAAAEK